MSDILLYYTLVFISIIYMLSGVEIYLLLCVEIYLLLGVKILYTYIFWWNMLLCVIWCIIIIKWGRDIFNL